MRWCSEPSTLHRHPSVLFSVDDRSCGLGERVESLAGRGVDGDSP
jgi:hypothetical protein